VTSEPGLIALDWGTSSLRAYLMGADLGADMGAGGAAVLDSRAEPWGVLRVPGGDFAAAFEQVTGPWRARRPGLKTIAAGMIGSAQGWVQVPYCSCPAGIDELAAALAPVRDGAMHIVPGIAQFGLSPDVMRGEETQIVGALEQHPDLAARSRLVLPGTHSKWVQVVGGKVHDFATYLTGELFAVLRDHSILGRPAEDAGREPDPAAAEAAFVRGVVAARSAAQGVAPLLFSARALVLAGRLTPEASLEYLSGLLIGEELRCGLTGDVRPLALVGDAVLCRRYAAALRLFGVEGTLVIDSAAPAGLWRIARRAGLVAVPREGARA